jgi:hypothetical protein
MSKAHDVPVDEMLFNLAAKEDIGMKYVRELHPKFNSILHNIPYPRAVISSQYCGYLDKKKQQEAYFHPVVIHYCIFKLWYTDAYSRYRRLGNEYTSRSPWPKPFTETIYKTKHEKFYGKYIYSLPYDWMIALASRTYHTFLWLLSVFTNKIHREKRYHKPPHFIRAIIRRGAFLKDRDIKATFSLPEKFRGANNKLTKN